MRGKYLSYKGGLSQIQKKKRKLRKNPKKPIANIFVNVYIKNKITIKKLCNQPKGEKEYEKQKGAC